MALLFSLFAYLTFADDWASARNAADKLRIERELVAWAEQHPQLINPTAPLYTDSRTARILYFLGAQSPVRGAVETYPFYWKATDQGLLKLARPLFVPGHTVTEHWPRQNTSSALPAKSDLKAGFWLINPRLVAWLSKPYKGSAGLDEYVVDIPKIWCFVASQPAAGAAQGGSIFEIPQGAEPRQKTREAPALDIVTGLQSGEWRINNPGGQQITPSEKGFAITLDENEVVRLVSEPMDWNSERLRLARESFLWLRMQAELEGTGGWWYKVMGAESGQKPNRLAVYRERRGSTSPHSLVLYIPQTIERLSFELTLAGPGSFEWQPPLIWQRVEPGTCN